MDGRIKRMIASSSLILALASPLYAQDPQPSKENVPGVEQSIDSLEQKIGIKLDELYKEQKKTNEEVTTSINSLNQKIEDLNQKVEQTNALVRETNKPHWYSGPIGYALALCIGIGGLFSYDYFKRKERINACNRSAEDYFEDEEFDLCIDTLEDALAIDSLHKETRYSLIDALIREEDNLRIEEKDNNLSQNDQERLSKISLRIKREINTLKKYAKKDFMPYLFEGNRLYFKGERETDIDTKREIFALTLEKYEEARGKYLSKKLSRYLTEIKVRAFKRKHSRLCELYKSTGLILKKAEQYDNTINALEEAKRYNEDDETIDYLLSDSNKSMGKILMEKEEYGIAVRYLIRGKIYNKDDNEIDQLLKVIETQHLNNSKTIHHGEGEK